MKHVGLGHGLYDLTEFDKHSDLPFNQIKKFSLLCTGMYKGSLHGYSLVPPNQTPKRFPAFSLEKNENCTKLR